jgi:hypothetical protein
MSNQIRSIEAMQMPDIIPGVVSENKPEIMWVKPETLKIDGSYQRDLSRKSMNLIKSIVANWSWERMKPVICAYNEAGDLEVIDGQHTAIGAASHPDVPEVLVMVVSGAETQNRAAAFIGHNKDRVAVTAPQLYYASLEAGDEVAIALKEACEGAGATIKRYPPPNGQWKIGEAICVQALLDVVKNKGKAGGRRLMSILVAAKRAPLNALEVKAVYELLYSPQWKGKFEDEDLILAIRARAHEEWKRAAKLAHPEEKSARVALMKSWASYMGVK